MRILHFLWSLNQGGAENLAVDLANQQSQDHDVILVVGNDCVDPSVRAQLDPAVRFIGLQRPEGSKNPYWVARLLWVLYRLCPDVIHSHTRDLGRLRPFISRPMVLTVHDVKLDLSKSAAQYDQLCCISEAVYTDVCQRYPSLNPIRVDNGIVISKIATLQKKTWPTVLSAVQVSRLVHEKKGQDILIRALAEVNAKHACPVLKVDFIGDGPSREYLVDLADELGVTSQCNFLGACSREDVYAKLCKYDMLIQPSRFEGFGLTVAEGMAAGIPVVVSDIDGPMEIICNGEYGYIFKNEDVAALVNTLETLITDLSTGVAQQRAAAARKHAQEMYGLQRSSQQYCDVYGEVIAQFEGAR